MTDIDAILREQALAFIAANAVVAVGDTVTTTWAGWKKPKRVRISSVGAHLVCRFDDGLHAWVAGYSMEYCAERLRKDGTSKERDGGGICLTNLQTDDGQWWATGGRWREELGFNHAGLSWVHREVAHG
jgi:hypothetical protein